MGLVTPTLKAAKGKPRPAHYPVLEINGVFYLLDLKFRMLRVRELARAQGFPDSFEFTGTNTVAVKAIGNSVSCGLAMAITLANETQNADISGFVS